MTKFLVLMTIVFIGFFSNVLAQENKRQCLELGELSVTPSDNWNKSCCEGLKKRAIKSIYSNDCHDDGLVQYADICLACGDGICDAQHESKCNCPEDCAKDKIKQGN